MLAGPEGPLRGRARRPLLVRRRDAAPRPERGPQTRRPGRRAGARPDGLRRAGPRREVGGRERRRGGHSAPAARSSTWRSRVSAMRLAPVGPRGPRGPAPRRLRLRRERQAARPGRGAPLRARRGRPSRRRRRRRAPVPGLPPPGEGARRVPRARRGGRAAARAGARRQAEEGRAGQAVGRGAPLSPRGCVSFGDLAADAAPPETAEDGDAALLRRAGGRGQALPAPSRPRARRRARARHDPGAQRLRWRTACGRSSWPSSASAGCPRRARSRTSS